MVESKDRHGWPLRPDQRVRVGGVAAVSGGAVTASWTGVVVALRQDGARVVVDVRADVNGGVRTTLPERCTVRKQTREEREAMGRRARRELALGS